MASYSFRPAKESDAAAVEACVHAAYGHFVARIGRKPGPMLDDYGEVIRRAQVTVAGPQLSVAATLASQPGIVPGLAPRSVFPFTQFVNVGGVVSVVHVNVRVQVAVLLQASRAV